MAFSTALPKTGLVKTLVDYTDFSYITAVLQHKPTATELRMLNAFQHYSEICMCMIVNFVHLTVTVKTVTDCQTNIVIQDQHEYF